MQDEINRICIAAITVGGAAKMSFVQVKERSGSSLPSSGLVDRTPFYGARVPDEVKLMIKAIKGLDSATVKKTLKLVTVSLEDGSLPEGLLLESVCTDKISEETARVIYSGLRCLVGGALRQQKLKPEAFKEDLSQLKLSPELITDLGSAVFGKKRAKLEGGVKASTLSLPRLEELKWRVDVAISNSTLNRLLEPSILMEMTLSDGSIKTFEIPVSKFHELRYSVAFVLKEIEDLEKRSVLKT